jgi:hypothetical protein
VPPQNSFLPTNSLSLSLALLHVLVDIDIGINVFLGLTGF